LRFAHRFRQFPTPVLRKFAAFQDHLRDTAQSLPEVSSAAHAMFIPFAPGTWGDGYRRAGTADSPPQGPMAHFFMVSPDYFEVMGMPIIAGRGLSPSDREGRAPVIVVGTTFARKAFPGEDPVGRRIEWNGGTWEIVGVTADVRHAALSDPLDADVYVPRAQVVRGNTWLLLRTSRSAAAVLMELQLRVKSIHPDIALTDAQTMEARLAEAAAPARFRAIVTGALAQRTREIGVRLALGQHPAAVVRVVLLDTARPVVIGRVPGVLASVYAGKWLSSVVLVNADPTAVLSAVVALFFAAALVAASGPAWRASRVDPVVALRTP
jgi:hypothetical protein